MNEIREKISYKALRVSILDRLGSHQVQVKISITGSLKSRVC